MERFYTLKESDVNQPTIKAFGQWWLTVNFIGRILSSDVGKRVYKVAADTGGSFILQAENDEQRQHRIG